MTISESGEYVEAGWEHVVVRHVNNTNSQSKFSLPVDEIRSILQSDTVVSTKVSDVLMSNGTPTYVRRVDVGKVIGNVRQSVGGGTTTKLYVQTDPAGNLITAYPIP